MTDDPKRRPQDGLLPAYFTEQRAEKPDQDSAQRLTTERADTLAREILSYKYAEEARLKAYSLTHPVSHTPMVTVTVPIGERQFNMDFYHLIHPLSVFEAVKAVHLAHSKGYSLGQDESVSNLTGQLTRLMKGQDLD